MSRHEKAHAIAEARIQHALATQASSLSLHGLRISDLPRSIECLAASLRELDLSECQFLRDVSALSTLTGLQTLHLSRCGQLTELTALAGLSGLQTLDLSRCGQLTELTALAGLSGLQTLDLSWCVQLKEVTALAGLSGLQTLDLSWCVQLKEVTALAGLSGLHTLNLSWCGQLTELTALAGLSGLQTLDLSNCRQLTELTALAELSGLQTLDLYGCGQLTELTALRGLSDLQALSLSWCGQLTELTELTALSGLQNLSLRECDQITKLTALAGLSGLQTLDLSGCGQLADVTALAGLSGLQMLDLSGCGQLTDVKALEGLDELASLKLFGTDLSGFVPASLATNWPMLRELTADSLATVPRELLSSSEPHGRNGDSCLRRMADWQADLETHGSEPMDEVKLFVLGNGRVGKTQVSRRLCGEAFEPAVPSTHGVVVRHFELPLAAKPPGQTAREVQLWDFGGQDLFLGTHSLFLDERALYLLLWHPAAESEAPVLDNGLWMPSHRLGYWLDYVKAVAGPQTLVIVSQAQCDEESQLVEPPVPADHGFGWLRRSACSAMLEEGLDRLLPELRAGAKLLAERHGETLIPRNWAALGGKLREMGKAQKVLALDGFDAMCREHGVSAPRTLLGYLHQSGQVFWRADVFGGAVILDQAWALEGVYALLHRQKVLPTLRRQGGLFTPELLSALLWDGEFDATEQAHFVSLMQACRVCFKVGDGQYIAADCLQERAAMASEEQAVWRGAEPDAEVRLRYPLLHGGLQRTVLCEMGEKAGPNAVYWRYGLCYHDAKARVTVRLSSEPGEDAGRRGAMVLQVSGPEASSHAGDLINALLGEVRLGQKPEVQWMKGQAVMDKADKAMGGNETEEKAALVNAAPLPSGVAATKKKPVVYVSYAWGGDSDATVDGLQAALAPWVEVHRDKDRLRNGDSIRHFEEEIGRGLCVIVVLSAKYMLSVDCMRELGFVWERAQRNAERFAERVVPVVLEDAGISRMTQRLDHVKHWRSEMTALEALVTEIGPVDCGQSTTRQLQDIRTFTVHLADALNALADRVMPRGCETLAAASYEPVLELIKRRLSLG